MLTPAFAGRIARGGLAALVQSGSNFLLGVVLVKVLSPREYGLYSFVFSLGAVGAIILNSVVGAQIGLVLPRICNPARVRAASRLFATVAVAITAVFIPISVVAFAWKGGGVPMVVVTATLLVSALMYRGYVRAYFYALRDARTVLRQDVFAAVGTGVGACLVIAALKGDWRLAGIFATMALGTFVSSIFPASPPRPAVSARLLRRHWTAFRRYRSRIGWSTLNVAMANLAGIAPTMAIVAAHSVTMLALITAPAVLFAPLRLTFVVLQSILRPELASLAGKGELSRLVRLYLGAVAVFAGAACLLAAAILIGWPYLYRFLFADNYAEQDLRLPAMLLFANIALACVRLPGAIMLNALGSFRPAALLASTVAAVVIMLAAILAFNFPAVQTLWASVAMEALMLMGEITLIVRACRAWRSGTGRAARG